MLKHKMLRDIREHRGQFIAIFLMAFLAVYMYTGVASEVVSVESAREKYQAETVLADNWIYGDDFTEENIKALKDISGVEQAQRRIEYNAIGSKDTHLYLYFQDTNEISKPYVLEGAAYGPTDIKSIWLNKRFASENGIQIGDDFTFQVDGHNFSLQVAGLIWSPEYEHYKWDTDAEPDYKKVGYGYSSAMALPTGIRSYNQIILKSSEQNAALLEKAVNNALNGSYKVFTTRQGIENLTALDNEIMQHKTMGNVFPVVFISIALLTIVTTMKRIVDNQRTQIGTLKAIGMKDRKIHVHYLSYGFVLSLLGTLLGIVLGPRTLAPMLFISKYFIDTSEEYMLPPFSVVCPVQFFVVGFLVVLLCTVVTWLSCRRLLKLAPAETLRPAPPKVTKQSALEKFPLWNRLSFSSRYNLRDMGRNKTRTIMGFAGTFCCMMLLICGFACKADFQSAVTDWYLDKLMGTGTFITLDSSATLNETEKIASEVDGELIMSDAIEIKAGEDSEKISSHINVSEGKGLFHTTDAALNVMTLTGNDFAVTQKTANRLGIKVGDTIEWHLYDSDQWVSSTVSLINRSPFEQGITTTRQALEQLGYDFTPTRIWTKQMLPTYSAKYVTGVHTSDTFGETLESMMEMMTLIMGFMLIMALVLAVVVLYSLGVLTFEERKKEMATLKVLGFRSRYLRNLLLRQNLWLAVAGAICGTPFGIKLLQLLCDSQGDAYDIPAKCSTVDFALAFAITVGVSVAVNLLFSKRIQKIDMVESLKENE